NIRTILSNNALNYIGIPLSQSPRPYIDSIIQPVPMSPSNINNISLRISPRSFIIGDEQEQRHSTVMGIFGTIAGFYSSLMFFYVFLFGVDSIRLWGVVHSGCCGIRLFKEKTKKIINNDLESVITSDSNILNSSRDPQASSQDLQESSKDSQNITSRIEELEKFRCFIEMNVIKIKPWEGHIKVKPSKKGNNTEE
ncbi:683_t:CDS:2, partial [Gigaspora rosea]